MPRRSKTRGALIWSLSFLLSASLSAATKTWTGAVSQNWSVAGNWTGGVPVAGDDLAFPQIATTYGMVNDLPAGMAFGSLAFQGTAIYTLNGNSLGLTGGIVNSGGPMLNVDISLLASQTFNDLVSLKLNGALAINGNTLTLNASSTVISGPITGSGVMTISGGYLSLTGASPFTGTINYNGPVTGALILDGSLPNATVVIGSGDLRGAGTTGSLTTNGRVFPGVNTIPNATGILSTGSLTLTAASTLVLDLNSPTAGTGYDQLHVTGTVNLGGGILAVIPAIGLTVGQSFAIIDNDASDPVSGTFAGLPEGAALTFNGITLQISYQGGTGNDVVLTVTKAPTKIWTGAVSQNWSVAGNWTGGVPVAGDDLAFPQVPANYFGMVNDLPAGMALGSLRFLSANYRLSGNSIGLTGGMASAGQILNVDISLLANQTFDSTVTLNGALAMNGNSLTLFRSDAVISGPITGSGVITSSFGYVSLSGTSPFTGTINFNGPPIYHLGIDGSLPNATVVIASGDILGAGTTGSLTANGFVQPGLSTVSSSTGILSTGNLTLTASSTLWLDLNSPTPGTGYDQLHVTGTVSLGGGTLQVTPAIGLTVGQSFVVIDNDASDPVSGTFAGLPEGATLTSNGITLRISYQGGTGNDVVLTVTQPGAGPTTPIPTLGDYSLLTMGALLALIALFMIRFRR